MKYYRLIPNLVKLWHGNFALNNGGNFSYKVVQGPMNKSDIIRHRRRKHRKASISYLDINKIEDTPKVLRFVQWKSNDSKAVYRKPNWTILTDSKSFQLINVASLIPVRSYVRSQRNQFGRSLYVHGQSALFMRYEMRLTVPLLLGRH